jgi:hypothetical protein
VQGLEQVAVAAGDALVEDDALDHHRHADEAQTDQ